MIKRRKIIAAYSFIAAILYLIFSIFEIIGYIYKDIFGGLALLVISITFFAGIKETWNGGYKGLSFTLGGLILAAIFGIMYIFILIADYLEWLIGNASMPTLIRPEILLFIFIIPLLFISYKEIEVIK